MHDLECRNLRISVWMSLLFILPSICGSAFTVDEQLDNPESFLSDETRFVDEEFTETPVLVDSDSLSDDFLPSIYDIEIPVEVVVNEKVESVPSAAVESTLPQERIGYNSSVRPFAKQGANLWARGEALYWRASEDNLYYAYSGTNANGTRIRNVETVGFNWDWGFRLGIGYTIPRDRWDLSFTWTHFHTENKSHLSADLPSKDLYINWWLVNNLSLLGNAIAAKGTWRPHLDQLDLSLGREFYVGKMFTMRPNAGLRTAWINQQLNTVFETTTGTAVTKMKNDFWGFGFFGGLDTKWMFNSHWNLFANGAAAILYGTFDVTMRGIFNRDLIFQTKKDLHSGKGVLDLQAGIEWRQLFFNNRFGVTVRAGYEYHIYADQTQLPLPTGNTFFPNSYTSVGGDLAYQGLFLSGQFDF